MLPKQEAKLTVNSSPNLFRLSLPEWLKEQVDSGKHKGVYWVNEKERIFHVPWKHASRNGWEDDDVSLFRAWAIYTNRYRAGVDKPKPALWKTNFRCAINSHNSITFLKDQGQRKGDKAHRIMRIIDPPKKNRSRMLSPDSPIEGPPRKLVRLTYPNFGPPHDSKSQHQPGQVVVLNSENKYLHPKGGDTCDNCNQLKGQLLYILENAFKTEENLERNAEYVALKSKYDECIASKEHVCFDKLLASLVNNTIPSFPFVLCPEVKPKPNLQDLYYIGKALQLSSNDLSMATIEVKTEGNVDIIDGSIGNISNIQSIEVKQKLENIQKVNGGITKDDESESEEKEDAFYEGKNSLHVEIYEEEDELITPRDT